MNSSIDPANAGRIATEFGCAPSDISAAMEILRQSGVNLNHIPTVIETLLGAAKSAGLNLGPVQLAIFAVELMHGIDSPVYPRIS